jgi:hypothetical protein
LDEDLSMTDRAANFETVRKLMTSQRIAEIAAAARGIALCSWRCRLAMRTRSSITARRFVAAGETFRSIFRASRRPVFASTA